jgi:hypothetical protein
MLSQATRVESSFITSSTRRRASRYAVVLSRASAESPIRAGMAMGSFPEA